MKKMFNYAASVLILVLIAGSLTACAGDGTAAGGGDEVAVITIGMISPLTGGVSQFGQAVYRGVNLYLDQHNARGGFQINMIVHDDEGTIPDATVGYHRLYDLNVTAIIGGVISGNTMAIVPLGFEDNMPMITGTATHAGVTVCRDTGQVFTNMFRSCFIDPFQGQRMAEFAAEVLGAQTFAVLYSNEIDYSIGLMESFTARALELGLTQSVDRQAFPDDAIDFRGQLTNIAGTSPDVLFVPAYYRHVGLIGPQSAEVGLGDTVFLGPDGWATIADFMDDTSSIEGSFFLTGFSAESDDPLVVDFVENYRARHGETPNMFAAQAYDAAKLLIAAIERTLSQVDYDPASEQFRIALIANMAASDIYGVTGRITFDQYNNPVKTAIILQVRDGEEVFWGVFPAE